MQKTDKIIKVLVTSNPLNHEGGVVNYYNILFKKNIFNNLIFYHSSIGSPAILFYNPIVKRLIYPFLYIYSIINVFFKVLFYKIDIIQINPSLIPVPILRDFPILIIGILLKKKVIVFIRGWKEEFFEIIKKHKIIKLTFVFFLNKADKIFVLANSFKDNLIEIGINNKKIKRTTTVIDEDKILPVTDNITNKITFLYLGRISQLKGIDEYVEAILKLYENEPFIFENLFFIFVGHEDKKGYLNDIMLKLNVLINKGYVKFYGRIEGDEKFEIYSNSDIYVFPSWTEGCPNSILEALASGLFVITTKVGAMQDIIIEKQNGYFVEKKNSNDLYQKLLLAINNINYIRSIKANIQKNHINSFSSKTILNFLLEEYKDLLK